MKAYVKGRNAVAVVMSHLRKPRFRRRLGRGLDGVIHRVAGLLPSRRRRLRRWLPLRH